MKKFLYLSTFFLTLFTALQVQANVITVKGHIKLNNGSPAVNTQVQIAVYVGYSTTSCSEQVVLTNSQGFYSKELSCSGDIRRSRISVKNCSGQMLVQEPEVPASKIIEANFTLCMAEPPKCSASFKADPVPATAANAAFSVKFNSSESAAGNGDNIIHRTWYFKDGTPPVTDKVDLIHTFPKEGTYEVCLVIKTAKGCENKVCKQMVIPPVNNVACVPKFTAEPVPPTSTLPPFSIKLNSSISEVGNGDNIIHRTWYFQDGTPPVADKVDLIHSFPKEGTYEVCLVIKTAKGCENKVCKQMVVPPVKNDACTGRFTFEKLGPRKFRFNGNMNVVAPNDNIIERKWDFKDGTSSTDVSPVHEFVKAGTYEVCQKIRTRNGCESHFCAVVKVEDVSAAGDPMIKIVSLYPLPVNENLKAVIFSKNNNVIATISIVNIYGIIQSTRQITLIAGFNPVAIPVNALLKGPYFIKVMTQYGTISKSFYKL